MTKRFINRVLRNFGVELHGLGYLEKLSKTSFQNDPLQKQAKLLEGNNSRIIFDVGANTGGVTQRYLDLFPQATIHAFEPIPELVAQFNQRHGNNNRVILNQEAMSNSVGEATFHINKAIDTSSLLESGKTGSPSDNLVKTINTITVNTNTVDNYCAQNQLSQIDILKMDTQGNELNILHGAENMLKAQKVKLIFCEVFFTEQYLKQPLVYDIGQYLRSLGYTLHDFYELTYSAKQVLYGDAIFFRQNPA